MTRKLQAVLNERLLCIAWLEQDENSDVPSMWLQGVIKLGDKASESKCTLVYGQMNEPPGARARVALTGASGAKPCHADVNINDLMHGLSLDVKLIVWHLLEASAKQDMLSAAKVTQMNAWCGYSADMNLYFDEWPSSTDRLELRGHPGECCCSCSVGHLA